MYDSGGHPHDILSGLWLVFVGFLAGILSGMGIGGGAILIPALTLLLGTNQQTAQSINLIYFIPTASIALFAHAKNKAIETHVVGKLICFGVVSAVAGSYVAIALSSLLLKKMFAVFLLGMGLWEFFKKR